MVVDVVELTHESIFADGERRQNGRKSGKAGPYEGPVMDMFWGDRCGTVVDPDGYNWMVAIQICIMKMKQEDEEECQLITAS